MDGTMTVFSNFEGGCYAKTIGLNKRDEPDIYGAIRRDALLENVAVRDNGEVDFDDSSQDAKCAGVLSDLPHR